MGHLQTWGVSRSGTSRQGAGVASAVPSSATPLRRIRSEASSPFAGVFVRTVAGRRGRETAIIDLHLRADGHFRMTLCGSLAPQGALGAACPFTWLDGDAALTSLQGRWRSTDGGVTLHAGGTRATAPIELAMSMSPSHVLVAGAIAGRPIRGELTVRALYADARARRVSEADIDGTWLVTTPGEFHAQLDGSGVYVSGRSHTVTFDASTHAYSEERSGDARPRSRGMFELASAPDGSAPGVVVLQGPGARHFATVTVASLAGSQLDLRVGRDRAMTLRRVDRAG